MSVVAWIRNRPLGLVYHDPAQAQSGYTLFSSVGGHHATLLDPEGAIVHRWHHSEGIQYARLLANGNLLVSTLPPKEADGLEQLGGLQGALVELDWRGQTVWEYRNPALHHDHLRLENGDTLILTWRKLPEGLTERVRGGHPDESDPERMWGDVVQRIDPHGTVLYEWRSWEHLDVDEDLICPLEGRKEWTHANSLDLTPDGRLLISFRQTDTVGMVDFETGDFTWKWGPGVLSHQHHASWLESGRVLVFDNGCHRRHRGTYSEVLEVDPASNEIAWNYKAGTIHAFFSSFLSGAERLANGNTFITEGASGRLFEVTPEGETVWEYVSAFNYQLGFGPSPAVFRAHRYPLDDPRFSGKTLSKEPYLELNARIERGLVIEEGSG
ncbi:MAG: aryl-sulfate sulfotransferase [Trueperaceae bacterium]|nr:MAG: aryl-sulfate sulfotransferase [Trueperaceae bacterium]